MSLLAKGVAHVSFKGGGLCLPARSPYDRQVLVDEVKAHARTKGLVQILVDDDRWLVHAQRGRTGVQCSRCGGWADSACYSYEHGEAPHCVGCAIGIEPEVVSASPRTATMRQAI